MRASSEARVGEWELIRVITIRHRAWLASRLPPGLSRWRRRLRGRCRGSGRRAQVRPGGFRPQPLGMVARRDQEQRGSVRADAVQGEQAGRAHGWSARGDDELIQSRELAVRRKLSAPPSSRSAIRVASPSSIAGPGPRRRQLADQGGDRVPGEPRAQVIGPVTVRDLRLVDGLGPLGAGAALGDHQRTDRLQAPSRPLGAPRARRDWAARAALSRIQRIGLALPAAVLAVRTGPPPRSRMPAALTWRARPAP